MKILILAILGIGLVTSSKEYSKKLKSMEDCSVGSNEANCPLCKEYGKN